MTAHGPSATLAGMARIASGSESRPALAHRYVDNLAALYAVDSELAAQIDALPFASLPPLETTRDGHWTARIQADNGKPIYVHSRYRPLEEARNLVQQQLTARQKVQPDGNDASTSDAADAEDEECLDELEHLCFFVSGIGLGYHVAELEQRFSKPFLIVADDDLAMIKAALCTVDLAEPIRDRRLTLLNTLDKGRLHERLRPIITPVMLGLRIINAAHAGRYHVDFHAKISGLMRDFVSYARLQMFSIVRNAQITCKNCAFNLPRYAAAPGIEALKGRAKGYPAILVAAGPSLSRNIDQLVGLKSRAVIIAVQTVLKTLLRRGVSPHIVTSLDFHEISAQFFQGIDDFGDTILVAEPKVTWRVPDTFVGRTHLLHSKFLEDVLREDAPRRGSLKAGSTVAHLAFYLAQYLGCDPIILVGQDLSFSEGLYYPPGMQIERIWRPELGRFQTIEMKQWERIVRGRSGLRKVRDIHGRETYTDDQLFTYAEQFQSDFLNADARVIHATEGGMLLAGTDVMTLAEAAAESCTRDLPPDLFALQASPGDIVSKDKTLAAVEARIKDIEDIRKIAHDTYQLLEKLMGLTDRPKEFNRLIVKVDELRSRMSARGRTYSLISYAAQLAELRRIHADRAIHDDAVETAASARRRLRRDREYVSAFIEGCDFLLEVLPQSRDRVREQMS